MCRKKIINPPKQIEPDHMYTQDDLRKIKLYTASGNLKSVPKDENGRYVL